VGALSSWLGEIRASGVALRNEAFMALSLSMCGVVALGNNNGKMWHLVLYFGSEIMQCCLVVLLC